MNSRLFFTSRLATAAMTQLPEFKTAFQFFLPMPAVLKNPMRSFFINFWSAEHCSARLCSDIRLPSKARRSSGFAHAFQNHICQQRLGADGRRIPEKFSMLFRRVAPGRLTDGVTIFHETFRFAEQHRDVLDRMQPVADEKWHHDAAFRPRGLKYQHCLRRCLFCMPSHYH